MLLVFQILLIGLIAFVISILGNIAGFGGGIFLVPSLILIFSTEAETAVATVLTALFFPSLLGTIGAWKRNQVDLRFGLIFGIPSVMGTFVGAMSIHQIKETIVVILIGVLALFFSIRMIAQYIKDRKKEKNTDNSDRESVLLTFLEKIKPLYQIHNGEFAHDISLSVAFVLGLIIGAISGLFGISGGWIQVPIFILLFRIDPLKATGTSLFIIVMKTFVGGLTYVVRSFVSELQIDWYILLVLAFTLLLGALFGHQIKGKIGGKHLTLISGIAILLVSIFTILSVIFSW